MGCLEGDSLERGFEMTNEQKVIEALKKAGKNANNYEISQVLITLYPEAASWSGWEFMNIIRAIRPPNKWSLLMSPVKESAWKVVFHHLDREEVHVVKGWKPIRELIRDAKTLPDVRYVEVGPRIGPWISRFYIKRG